MTGGRHLRVVVLVVFDVFGGHVHAADITAVQLDDRVGLLKQLDRLVRATDSSHPQSARPDPRRLGYREGLP